MMWVSGGRRMPPSGTCFPNRPCLRSWRPWQNPNSSSASDRQSPWHLHCITKNSTPGMRRSAHSIQPGGWVRRAVWAVSRVLPICLTVTIPAIWPISMRACWARRSNGF
jgi:hypothetical protein